MRIIVFIEEPAVIEKVFTLLRLWPAQAISPPTGYLLPVSRQRVIAA